MILVSQSLVQFETWQQDCYPCYYLFKSFSYLLLLICHLCPCILYFCTSLLLFLHYFNASSDAILQCIIRSKSLVWEHLLGNTTGFGFCQIFITVWNPFYFWGGMEEQASQRARAFLRTSTEGWNRRHLESGCQINPSDRERHPRMEGEKKEDDREREGGRER